MSYVTRVARSPLGWDCNWHPPPPAALSRVPAPVDVHLEILLLSLSLCMAGREGQLATPELSGTAGLSRIQEAGARGPLGSLSPLGPVSPHTSRVCQLFHGNSGLIGMHTHWASSPGAQDGPTDRDTFDTLLGTHLYQFPRTAVTNYHKRGV